MFFPPCDRLGGCGSGVIFIDADLKFSILQLSVIMELLVKRRVAAAKESAKKNQSPGDMFEDVQVFNKFISKKREEKKRCIKGLRV